MLAKDTGLSVILGLAMNPLAAKAVTFEEESWISSVFSVY